MKTFKLIWYYTLGVLWLPFELMYIIYSLDKDGKFTVSKVCIYLTNKISEED